MSLCQEFKDSLGTPAGIISLIASGCFRDSEIFFGIPPENSPTIPYGILSRNIPKIESRLTFDLLGFLHQVHQRIIWEFLQEFLLGLLQDSFRGFYRDSLRDSSKIFTSTPLCQVFSKILLVIRSGITSEYIQGFLPGFLLRFLPGLTNRLLPKFLQ